MVIERGDTMSVEYPRETPFETVIWVWAATALASWVLVLLAAAGLWWIIS